MKKVAFVIFSLLFVFSCKKAKDLLDIKFRFSTKNEFTLPKLTTQSVNIDTTITIKTPEIINTIPDEFKKYNADINDIKELTIENLTLTILSPENQKFDFLRSIKLYIGTDTKTPTKLIASKNNIDLINPSTNILELDVQNSDISEYIKGKSYYLQIESNIIKSYTTDIKINSEIKFQVVANPLN